MAWPLVRPTVMDASLPGQPQADPLDLSCAQQTEGGLACVTLVCLAEDEQLLLT